MTDAASWSATKEIADAIADVERVYTEQTKAREDALRSGELTAEVHDANPVYAYRFERGKDGTVYEIRKDSDGLNVVQRDDLE